MSKKNNHSKWLSFINRHYILLKIHYLFSYSCFASFGPILNLTLRNRGLSNLEISYISLFIPFLTFFTNPLTGYFVDHTRRFRLTFNIILSLATILFLIMFFLPSVKIHHIHGQIQQNQLNEYSLKFCAKKDFSNKCASKSQCGCVYEATCKLNQSLQMKLFHFNFTMNSTNVDQQLKNVSMINNKYSICDLHYRVPINQTIVQYMKEQYKDNERLLSRRNSVLANCQIKCSIDHLCDGLRYPNQKLRIILYSLLIIIGLNLFSNATTIGTSIGFSTIDKSSLFGRQRVWGTFGYGLTAFTTSRLYAHFQTDYVYLIMLIITTILSIIVTTFLRLKSDRDKHKVILEDTDVSTQENKEQSATKNSFFRITKILPLLKKIDVIIFFLTTFLWGMSFAPINPYLLLYIDEISPCQSHSMAGYMSLITSGVEIIALFISDKLLTILGIRITTIVIFISFSIRFIGYYLINNIFYFLPFETMHFFNFGILFVLITQEANTIAPTELAGTLQGIVSGISFGLGHGIGLLVSLFIYTKMKKRRLFLIYSIFNLIGAVIYLVYCLFNRKRSMKANKIENPTEEALLSSANNKK